MGKFIGVFLGFLLAPRFGFFCILFGFLLGAYFDLRIKSSTSNFFYSPGFGENILIESFPILAGSIAIAGGINKTTVLTVKNISIQIFNRHIANIVMKNFKNYVENGISSVKLQEACDNILYNFDYQSKLYIISLLTTILKAKGEITNREIYSLKFISTSIGIYEEDFETFFNNFNHKNNYNNFSGKSFHEQNPYEVLEISKDSTDKEIKKQYRTLCKKYHPDLSTGLPENEKKQMEIKMKKIINAYEKIKKLRNIN
jgi:DnaJ-domain-containing protein 1